MAISSIIRNPKQLLDQLGASPAKINDMILDVVVKEAPTWSWTTSQYKTQSGFVSSDVRIKNPDRLVIDCVFVDKQYGAKDIAAAGLTGEGFAPETWRDKYKTFKDLVHAEDIVTVTIGLDTYSSMQVKQVDIIRDSSRAGYLGFTVTLEELRVIDTDFDEVDTSLMPGHGEDEQTKPKKSVKKKRPDKKRSEPKKATEPQKESTLYSLVYGG